MIRFAIVLMLATGVFAQTYFGMDAGAQTQYLSRGAVYDTKPVLWPDLWISRNGGTAVAFANIATSPEVTLNEVDLIVSWVKETGPVTDTLGVCLLTFPGTGINMTSEVSAATAWAPVPWFSLSAAVKVDVLDAAGGVYGGPSFALSKELVLGTTFTVRGSMGFANAKEAGYLYGDTDAGWKDITGSVSAAKTLGSYTVTLTTSGTHRPYRAGDDQNVFWAGFNVGYSR